MNILGIETSCDETAAAVVGDGGRVLSSIVASQADLHGPYGGVVPEIASRRHLEMLPLVLSEAVARASLDWSAIDGVAVTYGPGLATSLLVGLSAAKALALRLGRPLFAVNHLHAHIGSAFLAPGAPPLAEACPFLALVVSGGHTCLVRVDAPGRYVLLGETCDDAAGEAFDKGANLLELGYPGGPAIDRAAREGDPAFVRFPRGRPPRRAGRREPGDPDPALCFSFSGLKTALLYYLKEHPLSAERGEVASLAASYQEAIVDALVARCGRALRGLRTLAAGGGVILNGRLRARLQELAAEKGVRLLLAEPRYCGDNAAMVAAAAATGPAVTGPTAMAIDLDPNLEVAAATAGR